ncbi:efflux RND transporter periplasmic adaptor subunit [bacterium]|nr:efflux RND transporter periplasmic adaptor subunit [bacterium]
MRVVLHLATFLLLVLIAAGCPKGDGQQGPGEEGGFGGGGGPPPVPVVVAPVELRDYAPAIELVGEIRASKRATLAAEVSGRVVAISHRLGEAHPRSAGALIRIDASSYQVALDGAQARLAAAKEALRRLEKGPREQEIAAQEAAVTAARATEKQALDNFERQEELFEAGVIPESALVAAQAQADAASANCRAAEEMLNNLLAGSREEDIAAASAQVDLAKSNVGAARLDLSRTSVTPAFNAVVSALFVEVGQFVAPGTPLVEVVADGPGEAWFNLPEEEVARVNPGDAVELRLDALMGEVFDGEVISISPAAEKETRQFPVRVAVSSERLKPGMAVRGRLLTEEPRPTMMISEDATLMGNLGLVTYRMTPPAGEGDLPGVEMVPIVTGQHIDDLVVVVEGDLEPGQMVVTRGKEQLYPGAKIIPTNLMGEGGPGGAPGMGGGPPDGMGPPGEAHADGPEEAGGESPGMPNEDEASDEASQ